MSDFVLETHGLRKQFGEKVAVADLTLTVRQGEVFGFLGPNGAGKTTSIKMLLGLVAPTAGTARLLGAPIGSIYARARLGFLPEHFRFHDWLTGREFLRFHGQLYRMSTARLAARIEELLARVDVLDAAKACCNVSDWLKRCSTSRNWCFSMNPLRGSIRWDGCWCAMSLTSYAGKAQQYF